jgi:hypothetical protein
VVFKGRKYIASLFQQDEIQYPKKTDPKKNQPNPILLKTKTIQFYEKPTQSRSTKSQQAKSEKPIQLAEEPELPSRQEIKKPL